MFRLIKQVFIGLLSFSNSRTSTISASNYTKCLYLNNQQCMIQPTLINLHSNEYTRELCYYSFAVNLDRYVGSCNT